MNIMPSQEMESRKKLAFKLLVGVNHIILRGFEKVSYGVEKTRNDFVTNVDLKSEQYLIDTISKNFPEDSIQSEERGLVKGKAGHLWMLDPLDGTNNYLRGIPQAGAQIAILKNEKPMFGALLDAFGSSVYYAEAGRGAFQTNLKFTGKKRLSVSQRPLKKGLVILSSKLADIHLLRKMLPMIGTIRIYGVAILDFPFIAKGNAEALISSIPKPMDITAGSLLIEEAGGKVTTFDNKPWYPDMTSIVASNAIVHNKIIRIINS